MKNKSVAFAEAAGISAIRFLVEGVIGLWSLKGTDFLVAVFFGLTSLAGMVFSVREFFSTKSICFLSMQYVSCHVLLVIVFIIAGGVLCGLGKFLSWLGQSQPPRQRGKKEHRGGYTST